MGSHFAVPLAAAIDRMFARTALTPSLRTRRQSSAGSLGHDERMRGLLAIGGFYDRPEYLSTAGPFFPAPASSEPESEQVRRIGGGGTVVDLSWRSGFRPLWSTDTAAARCADNLQDAVRHFDRHRTFEEKYNAAVNNRVAYARWFRHDGEPRPCVVILHGYMTGHYALEERLWPVSRLFERGYDVVLSQLPFHGRRRDRRRGLSPPAFPSGDPRFTVEGFRQFVQDQRTLFDFLLAGRVQGLGVLGVSLGGYGAALLSTLEPRLLFTGLIVPLAAIELFAHRHGRLMGNAWQQQQQAEALALAQSPISPLSRPSVVPPERVLVMDGRADQVTGARHAELLTQHFGASRVRFDGGHVLQAGRRQAFRKIYELLERTAPP